MTDFIISDHHFGHANIIKYCDRPYETCEEMDQDMMRRWNEVVSKDDIVYYVGDFSFYPEKYVTALNGKIIVIIGNHDKENKLKSLVHEIHNNLIITLNNKKVLLIHNPRDIPDDWNSWVIYGHTHNHDNETVPVIDKSNKRINVCVENWNYTPIHIDTITKIIR